MTVLPLVVAFLFTAGFVLLITGLPRRRKAGQFRCPQCRYDVGSSIAEGRCPECGYTWREEVELRMAPARRGRLIVGNLALVVAFVCIVIPMTRRHWTENVPRPLLAVILQMYVPVPATAPGRQLPTPDPAQWASRDRWERLVWQQQAALAVEVFLDRVEQADGTDDDLHQLAFAAIEAHALYEKRGSTSSSEAWPMRQIRDRARANAADIDDRYELPLGTWAAAELQYIGGNPQMNWDWLPPPVEVLDRLANAPQVNIRIYAVDRLAVIAAPEASAILERLDAADPDDRVRRRAEQAIIWRRGVRGWP